jgi:hypothetical protein
LNTPQRASAGLQASHNLHVNMSDMLHAGRAATSRRSSSRSRSVRALRRKTVLAANRVGASPMNVITPLLAYLPFIIVVAQRYQKETGIGTLISLMIPFTLSILVLWIVFFIIWYVLGSSLAPSYPVDV